MGAPRVFERRSHIDGNIMGENKAKKQKFPSPSPTPKVKKLIPHTTCSALLLVT
jgi:hypothetical protein